MSYEEKRVRTADFGSLPGDSELLVDVPTIDGQEQQRLHTLAAQGMQKLAEAIQNDLGIELKIASGWRKHRWESFEQYKKIMIQKYGSLEQGRKFLAFDSPHETGLAMDIGVGGLEPKSATRDKQSHTEIFKWMVEHAWEYGWHPYKVEPWHWEFPVSMDAYKSGTIADGDPGHTPSEPAEGEQDVVEAHLDENG